MSITRWLLVAVFVFGCGDKQQASRPASITQEMADTFEAYVVAFEKLTTDVDHAGTDCHAALVAVQHDSSEVAALAPRGEALRKATQDAKGDVAATEWFAKTYAERMGTAAAKLAPLENNCGKDTKLQSALGAAMELFPMMRKKH